MPERARMRGGQGKWLVRNVLDRHVPRELLDRPKIGVRPTSGGVVAWPPSGVVPRPAGPRPAAPARARQTRTGGGRVGRARLRTGEPRLPPVDAAHAPDLARREGRDMTKPAAVDLRSARRGPTTTQPSSTCSGPRWGGSRGTPTRSSSGGSTTTTCSARLRRGSRCTTGPSSVIAPSCGGASSTTKGSRCGPSARSTRPPTPPTRAGHLPHPHAAGRG